MTESLYVNWSASSTLQTATTWYEWSTLESYPTDPLEEQLHWPEGTIAALRRAFQLKLSRSTGWKIGNHSQHEALAFAATIFRRGVVSDQGFNESQDGTYSIDFVDSYSLDDDSFFIIEKNLASIWNIKQRENIFILEISEKTKTLETIARIAKQIRENPNARDKEYLTIVGGGVLADTAAFCASLLGKKFVLIPTTLLAMVDACIGGKTGVNFPPFGKNQIGHFAFPSRVVISKQWLKTLPPRETLAGMSESFKHAVIVGDKKLAQLATLEFDNMSHFASYIMEYVKVKKNIVEIDPMEQGKRSVLNFGHTFAHAVEAASHSSSQEDYILHGEAVGIGMLFALHLSHNLGYLRTESFHEIKELLNNASFMVSIEFLKSKLKTNDLKSPALIQQFLEAIHQDKKNETNKDSMWVLLSDWGEFVNLNGKFTTSVNDKEIVDSYLNLVDQLALH